MRRSGGGLDELDELELSLQGHEEPVYAVLAFGEGRRKEVRALRPRPWPP